MRLLRSSSGADRAADLPTFSLLHATHRRSVTPVEVKDAWLRQADHPELVEYIFGLDEDDPTSLEQTDGHPRVVSPPSDGVTAVRNWNAAAAASSGDLLVVVADDLFPRPHWDTSLRSVVARLDPRTDAFAIKVSESGEAGRQDLLRHPVVSRAFYERLSLFSPAFTGVYCDDDITVRAMTRAAIIDARHVRWEHRHPSNDAGVTASASQSRINSPEEYARGRAAMQRLWPARQRRARVRFVRSSHEYQPTPADLARTKAQARLLSHADYLTHLVRRAPHRLRGLLDGP